MGKCKYCGQEAGLLRSVHNECELKHGQGTNDILALLTKAARGNIGLEIAEMEARQEAEVSFIGPTEFAALLIRAYESAVTSFLDDGLLSRDEEDLIAAYLQHFHLSTDVLSDNAAHMSLVKAAVLRDVMDGKYDTRVRVDGTMPFNFQKSETLLWLFPDAEYCQPRTRTSYQGRSSGVSLRVAKGVYYRIGQFQGNPVANTQIALLDTGMVAITNKHLYFAGDFKSLRVRFDKVVSVTPYSDAIAIQRDDVTRLDIFKTGDGWFTYNLVMNLAKEW